MRDFLLCLLDFSNLFFKKITNAFGKLSDSSISCPDHTGAMENCWVTLHKES
jgi:hypothetical protein